MSQIKFKGIKRMIQTDKNTIQGKLRQAMEHLRSSPEGMERQRKCGTAGPRQRETPES